MTWTKLRGENIRRFILDNVEHQAETIAQLTARRFGITRQAAYKHLARLVKAGLLEAEGHTRQRRYKLRVLSREQFAVPITATTEEDRVWRERLVPLLTGLSENVFAIWHHGFTEMFNNALDHSGGRRIGVEFIKTAATTEMKLVDDGEGVFNKIQRELGLYDARHAMLELSKGKLTTDPEHHTGEGIFFTSRMFDEFSILSGGLYFSHQPGDWGDWLLNGASPQIMGTTVLLKIANRSSRTVKAVFDEFAEGADFGFTKTVVPVRLAQHEGENLVSRSQAKRLVVRFERFKTVLLDFSGVQSIGQAFADEIFRVFANAHPEVQLLAIHANPEIMQMIRRVTPNSAEPGSPLAA